MNRREWMQSGLGAAVTLLTTARASGDGYQDDSDPAPLIAKIGPMMEKAPIQEVEFPPACT